MTRELTLTLTGEDARELAHLCAAVGFPPEMTAVYAIRLVSACVREGLFADFPDAWPGEARSAGLFDTGTGGKVLAFERGVREEE